MVFKYETGKFKRDVKQRDGKEVVQIRVTGLSVKSEFEDGEDLIIMSKSNFDKFVDELDNAGTKDTKAEIIDSTHYDNIKIIDLQDKLLESNTKYYGLENNFNGIINEITAEITKLYNTEITTANTNTINNIKNLLVNLQEQNTNIIEYALELENQTNEINKSIDNSSIIKRAFSKDSFKLNLDTDNIDKVVTNLKLFNEFDTDTKAQELIQSVEIPASDITNIVEDTKTKKLPNDNADGNDSTAGVIINEQSNGHGTE